MVAMAGPVVEMIDWQSLTHAFGERLQRKSSLGRFTAARVGGPADALLQVRSAGELADAAQALWNLQIPFVILGGGSNVLVSDAGVRGVVILNHARHIRFDVSGESPSVWAESGANFGVLARRAAQRGLAGLEWAVGIPGTIGGAVVGNAGAHGSDMASSLVVAEILHHNGMIENWPVEKFGYTYRGSNLKSPIYNDRLGLGRTHYPAALVLSATLRLERNSREMIQEKLDLYLTHRRRTQPPGASMGSMFKNPPGDYAGRLIEATGLKGMRIGDAEISSLHANFFINTGHATATDIWKLIDLARRRVEEMTGIKLDLEIELMGEW